MSVVRIVTPSVPVWDPSGFHRFIYKLFCLQSQVKQQSVRFISNRPKIFFLEQANNIQVQLARFSSFAFMPALASGKAVLDNWRLMIIRNLQADNAPRAAVCAGPDRLAGRETSVEAERRAENLQSAATTRETLSSIPISELPVTERPDSVLTRIENIVMRRDLPCGPSVAQEQAIAVGTEQSIPAEEQQTPIVSEQSIIDTQEDTQEIPPLEQSTQSLIEKPEKLQQAALESQPSAVEASESSKPSRFRLLLRGLNVIREKVAKTEPTSLWLVLIFAVMLGSWPANAQDSVALVGAGSTVPLPLYQSWAQQYNSLNRKATMQYQPLGTSEGIKLVSSANKGKGQSDFGAGEVLLTEQERSQGDLLELPAVMIAIVPVYNVPGLSQELKFSGELLAEIYLGKVKNWNAPQIAKLNPGASLPSLAIKVVYRPAGKGTNYVFTDFLSKKSVEFRNQIGRTASPKWPLGVPAERSSDMADKVKAQAGAIGYVEVQYANSEGISVGLVENGAGKFVKASDQTIEAACKAIETPEWNKFAVSLTNAPGAEAYPITSFSWIYVRKTASDARRRAALMDMLGWIYSNGQQIADRLGYAELPPQLLQKVKTQLGELK